MKEDFTKFRCESCEKEIIIVKGEGYPYDEGWCYLYNFTGTVTNPSVEKNKKGFENKDKHFCSTECMIKFIGDVLKNATKGDEKQNV